MKKSWLIDLIAVGMIAAIFLGGCFVSYRSYYFQTKPAVRYHDFRILAYTLPQILPGYITNKNYKALKAVVDLPGKNFGIVIETHDPNKQWVTKNNYQDFSADIKTNRHQQFYAIPIMDAPFACLDWEQGCRISKASIAANQIGTLYLVHQIAPSFWQSMVTWMSRLTRFQISVLPNIAMLVISSLLALIYLLARQTYLNWQSQKRIMNKMLIFVATKLDSLIDTSDSSDDLSQRKSL